MPGIANMPRVETEFVDYVFTDDGILKVTLASGVRKLLSLAKGMRRIRNEFYAQFVDTSPVGMDNVKLIPWSDVTSVRIHTSLFKTGPGFGASRVYPLTTLNLEAPGDTESIRMAPRIVNSLTPILQRNLGDRFEIDFDQSIYDDITHRRREMY